MAQIGAGMPAADRTDAIRIGRPGIRRVPGVLDRKRPVSGEELPIARIARRKYAVEQIDASSDRLDQIARHACSHEVSRPIRRELRSSLLYDVIHERHRLADRKSA